MHNGRYGPALALSSTENLLDPDAQLDCLNLTERVHLGKLALDNLTSGLADVRLAEQEIALYVIFFHNLLLIVVLEPDICPREH